jgi:phosphoglycolate phosphatase
MSLDIRLVIFDCDGTLVDSQHVIVDAMQAAFDAHGLTPPAPHDIRRAVGLSLPQAMAMLLPSAEEADHDHLAERYKQAFIEQRAAGMVHPPLYPGADNAVRRLAAAGHVLGVATGKSRRGLDLTLEHFTLGEFFSTLQTADDAPSKPHPAMVEQAIAETGATPETTVLIGDTTFDIEMACAAGAAAIGVEWGYHDTEDLLAAGAATVVANFEEIDAAVARAFGT